MLLEESRKDFIRITPFSGYGLNFRFYRCLIRCLIELTLLGMLLPNIILVELLFFIVILSFERAEPSNTIGVLLSLIVLIEVSFV